MHKAAKTKNPFMTALFMIVVISLFFTGHAAAEQKQLGGLTPEKALEYMKKTPNLFVLDVSPMEKFKTLHFVNSVNIPYEELLSRINEIPRNRPVIVHCRLGRTCIKAYPLLKDMRPDIPELSYISGTPLFEEYNEWIRNRK